MDIAKNFGSRVKALRKRKGLTQQNLAELSDRSIDSISQIERGINSPNIETLGLLSSALNVPIGEFFENLEEDPKRSVRYAEAIDILRSLSDRDLQIAVTQLGAFETVPDTRK